MNVKTLMTVAVILTAGLATQADTTGIKAVADEISVQLHNAYNKSSFTRAATNTVNAVTATQAAEYPASVTAPAFWVDCSDTTGWHFGTEGGKQVVTNIPSRQGSKWTGVRWLTTRPGGGDWVGWGSAEGKQDKLPTPPFYATNATGALGNGGHYLDFSANRRALLFNTDGAGYNALTNIGTVIAVWGSDVRNGGHLLGGGAKQNYGWHRAGDFVTGTGASCSTYRWSSTVMNGNAQDVAEYGYLWHDGQLSAPYYSGYNGGWEVLSLQCKSATAEACGIGVNDKRYNMDWVSGGQEVAEVLIYDEVLTRADIEKVEIYLEQKWFGRKHTGWNGKGRAAVVNAYETGFASEIRVPAGETLEVDRLTGGTKGSLTSGAKATKTGAGTLVFAGEGAQKYASDIVLAEGTLSYPALKSTPTAATLPAHLYAHFDASEAASRTADDNGGIAKWANLAPDADAKVYNKPFALMQNTVSRRPTVLADELGDGLDVLDFGPVNKTANAGQCLWFTTNETAVIEGGKDNAIGIHGIQTVVVLIGVQNGGGTLFNNSNMAYERDYPDAADSFHRPLLCNKIQASNPVITGSDCRMWVDGQRWDPSLGYAHPGYQVVAFQVPGDKNTWGGTTALMRSAWGYGGKDWAGGARIGELLMWNRALTEEELLDAQAYLMAKWLKRDAPGYARAAGQFVAQDLQNLNVPAGSRVTLDVAAGRTVRIGQLTVAGELVKTGAGTVEVEKATYLLDGKITTLAGTVNGVGVRDVTSAAELAPGASLHLDVTQTDRMVTGVSGDETRIRTWSDETGRIGAWSQYSTGYRNQGIGYAPALTTAEAGLNGYPVADFKAFGSSGRYMLFERPLHAIRSVYAVVKYPGGKDSKGNCKLGFLLGTGSGRNEDGGGTRYAFYPWEDVDNITFHPGLTSGIWDGRLFGYSSGVFDGAGNCRTNGVQVASSQSFYVATNCFQLLELHPQWPVPAAQIGLDRDITDRLGGFQLAEIVIYERQLSEREKVATRNHLMRKWFDKGYSDPLPAAPEKPEIRSYEIVVDGEDAYENGEDEEKVRVRGEGTLTKTGDGTLTVRDLSEFSGTINVSEGSLEVLYADPYATPNLPKDGIIYHADATKGLTTTTNANNVICVSQWANQGSAPLKAVASGGNADYQKVIFDADVGYRPTVDINGWNACMVWQKADGSSTDIQTLSGIKSVFWLIGSQNGGGWMLGGGTNATGELSHMWHRGIYYPNWPATTPNYVGNTNLCTVLNGNMQKSIQPPNASWWKNGSAMGWGDYLSGKWDQLSMIVADDTKDANASGFAYDGRSRKASGASNHEYNGHQRIAEIICYNRRVSDEERQGIECYLRCKWNSNMHAAATNVVVNVAAGAALTLGGDQTLAGVTGAGTITGNVTAGAFAATTDGGLAIDGTLTIAANPTVAIDYAATVTEYVIATANAVEGVENLGSVTFTGLPTDKQFRLRVRKDGDKKVLKATAVRGTVILLK